MSPKIIYSSLSDVFLEGSEIKKILLWGQKALQNAKINEAFLEAEILLEKALKIKKEEIFKNPQKKISYNLWINYQKIIKERCSGRPLFYILKEKEFLSYSFFIKKGVFIPRIETEDLVEEILKDIFDNKKIKKHILVDVGTGSGCIAISLAKKLKESKILSFFKIYATDISKKALKIAQLNAQKYHLGKEIYFLKGNLLLPLRKIIKKNQSFLIVANLPYIKDKDFKNLPFSIKNYEPKKALVAGNDGLLYYRRLFKQIKKFKIVWSKIFLEIDPRIKKGLEKLAKKKLGKIDIYFQKDLSGKIRIAKISPLF